MQPEQSTKISQIKYKIIFLGEMTTGKTSIIQRFTKNQFLQQLDSTVGFDFITKNIYCKTHTYKLQLWDTAGQQRFFSLTPNYLRDKHCAVFVYDITDQKTFNNLNRWLQLYQQNQSKDSIAILVGNKSDKKNNRQVSKQKASQWAKKYQMSFIQVSAKNGQGVEDIFDSIIDNIDATQITSQRELYRVQNIIQEAKQTDRTLKVQNQSKFAKKKKSILNISITGQKQKLESIKLNKNSKLKLGQKKKQFVCCYI